MKSPLHTLKISLYIAAAGLLGMMASCTPEKLDEGITASGPAPEAAFTLTPVPGSANRYVAAASTKDVIAVKWDKGDGGGPLFGKMVDTLFFPDAGVYTVGLTAIGKGGLMSTSTRQVTIATSDPVAGNLIKGGKFNPGDEANWTKINIGNPPIDFSISNGKMVATGGNWGHAAIYQAVQVQANKPYRFSMLVSGSGATDTWFEVYFGTTQPVNGSDYNSGGIRLALNTWAGCGNAPFNGNLATIACEGSLRGQNGVVTFNQTGTIYIMIKTGGSYLGSSGIAIDNVELRGI
jgi:PKD repeat protein